MALEIIQPQRRALSENVVEVFSEDDLPISTGFIRPVPGITYLLQAPIVTAAQLTHPVGGSILEPSVIVASARSLNTITWTGTATAWLETVAGSGGLILQNMRVLNAGTGAFVNVSGAVQNGCEVALKDCDVVGFDDGSLLRLCLVLLREGALWIDSGTLVLADVDGEISDDVSLNSSDQGVPWLDVRATDENSVAISRLEIVNTRISSFPGEAFFRIHPNLTASSRVRILGVSPSSLTPGGAAFYEGDSGAVTALANSAGAPGVRTVVQAAGHSAAGGDLVTLSGFAVQTQLNADFVVQDVVPGVSFEIVSVFVATDSGAWSYASLDQKSPNVNTQASAGSEDSQPLGTMFVVANATATVITSINQWTDFDLGGLAQEQSNIQLFELTDTTTGELTYNGLDAGAGTLLASISAESSGGTEQFAFRAVKNGSVLPDPIVTLAEIGNAAQSTALVVPLELANGDTIRLQVQNLSSTGNVTVSYLSVSISQ